MQTDDLKDGSEFIESGQETKMRLVWQLRFDAAGTPGAIDLIDNKAVPSG